MMVPLCPPKAKAARSNRAGSTNQFNEVAELPGWAGKPWPAHGWRNGADALRLPEPTRGTASSETRARHSLWRAASPSVSPAFADGRGEGCASSVAELPHRHVAASR